jgi:uncharacterized repeat protein (TIGR01451 family)
MDPYMVGTLLNRARIGADAPDGNPFNDRSTWPTTLLLPDMGIQVQGPAETVVLTEIQYTITYANAGDREAQQVVITDVLPSGVTYLSDDSGFDRSEPVPGTHVWQVEPHLLLPGEGGSFVVTASVGDYGQVGTALHNTVMVWAATPDGDWTDNMVDLTTQVLLPDLGIRVEGPVAVGERSVINYTLAYSNAGGGEARSIVLTDTLPTGVTFVSDDSGFDRDEVAPGTYTWQVGQLSAGDGGSFTLLARLGTLGETGSEIVNTAMVGADTPDTAPGNNTSQWTTAVEARSFMYLPIVLKASP